VSWLAGLLAAAVLLGWARLARAPVRGWRVALLALGQPLLAGSLYLTLAPPPVRGPGAAVLTVATRGARAIGGAVALPEALAGPGAARAPDLATALRRHPETATIRVLGQGLEPRDRAAAADVAVRFDAPAPTGLTALAPPGPVAAGAAFRVGAEVRGIPGATVELLDAGRAVIDRASPGAAGQVVLTGVARVPGLALFGVRVRSPGGVVASAAAPVVTRAAHPVRTLFLAGSASPEVKQWRRWAADAGLAAETRVTLGAGLVLGDPTPPLSAASLARIDVLILDDRAWATLSAAERGAVAAALRGGLGVVLRVTGPLDTGTRAGWRGLGLAIAGEAVAPDRLTSDRGLATTRLAVALPDSVPMLRDAAGEARSGWRAVGLGRVALWPFLDAAGLVTAGQGAQYGALWSEAVSAVARPQANTPPRIEPLPSAATRVTLSALAPGAAVVAPDGAVTRLLIDGGVAGYWPRLAGWHAVRQGAADWPFYIYPADALSTIRAADRRDATLMLTANAAHATTRAIERPGASWPWFLAFLTIAAALWWFERSRLGR